MTDFILGFHCHQPLGNFDDVSSKATADAYVPILRALDRHPGVKVVLHFSGCLLEWAETKAPELFDRIGALVVRGQAELLGGGFYEPILPIIPERDATGQILWMRAYLEARFGARVRGIWLTERVWEPGLAAVLARAGVEYLPVDDVHLLAAGLGEQDMRAAWRSGGAGGAVSLYPIREALRYLIPFRPVQESLDWLRALGEGPSGEGALAVMADDGEKFGVWPGTSEWVHGNGWMEAFLTALEDNRGWLRTLTFSEREAERPPQRSIFVPPASYFEMGEWALPVPSGRLLRDSIHKLRDEGRFDSLRPFIKGGNWRYFLTKYPESDHLLDRVGRLSRKIDQPGPDPGPPVGARKALWQAQCNCPYWHGVFGGIYLPFLRAAVEGALVRARRLHEQEARFEPGWIAVEPLDDAPPVSRQQPLSGESTPDLPKRVRVDTARFGFTADAGMGGALLDLEFKELDLNVSSVLARREEIYHDELAPPSQAPAQSAAPPEAARTSQALPAGNTDAPFDSGRETPAAQGTPSIHDRPATGDRGPVSAFVYDARPRLALLDHLYEGVPSAEDLVAGRAAEHDPAVAWARGPSPDDGAGPAGHGGRARESSSGPLPAHPSVPGFLVRREAGAVTLELAGPSSVARRKVLETAGFAEGLRVRYEISSAAYAQGASRWSFGPELPVALWEAHGRIFWEKHGASGASREESLSLPADLDEAAKMTLTNEMTGLRVGLEMFPPAAVRTYPIRTISRSESGYDEIYQGTIVQILWTVPAAGDPDLRTSLRLRLERR